MTRDLRALTAAAALGTLLAACGPGPAAQDASSPAAAASNKAAAGREADRLLAAVPVPSGAVGVVTAPPGLEDPPAVPAVDSLVVRSRFLTVHLRFEDAKTWFAAHPPAHLEWSGGSDGSDGPYGPTTSWSADAPSGPAWGQAMVDVAIVGGDAGSTKVRVDALVVWLDPTPDRDLAGGDGRVRVRVTVAGGCPAKDTNLAGVTAPDGTDLDARMLPAARPTGGLVCRYTGGNPDGATGPESLLSSRALDAAAAARFADAVAAVPLAHSDGGMHSCPMDDGAAAVVALSYPGRPDVDLSLKTNGCTAIANGRIAAGADTAALLAAAGA